MSHTYHPRYLSPTEAETHARRRREKARLAAIRKHIDALDMHEARRLLWGLEDDGDSLFGRATAFARSMD